MEGPPAEAQLGEDLEEGAEAAVGHLHLHPAGTAGRQAQQAGSAGTHPAGSDGLSERGPNLSAIMPGKDADCPSGLGAAAGKKAAAELAK